MIDYTVARTLAELLSAIGGDVTRMEVIQLLFQKPRSVGELADLVGIPMMNMSHHLGILRVAGVVEVERRGRSKIYSLAPGMVTAPKPRGSVGGFKLHGENPTTGESQSWSLTVKGLSIKSAK
jgi:DNA-binding transcriptional ArsR family regulator